MNLRFAMILTFVLALFVYVGWRLSETFGAVSTVAIMAVLFGGVFFYRTFHRLKNRSLRHFFVNAVHMEMGFLSFLLTWIVLRDLIFIPAGYWKPEIGVVAYGWWGTLSILVASLLTLVAGVAIANAGPWTVKVNVPIRDLPADLEGFTIAQLSDMHIGPTTSPATVERIVRQTLALKPDAIALTGDIGDGPVSESIESIRRLGALTHVPSFYVTGNHEYYWNGPEWIAAFAGVGLRPILNAYAVVQAGAARVVMIGTPDPTARMLGPDAAPDVALAARTPASQAFSSSLARSGSTAIVGTAPTAAAGSRTEVRVLLAHQPGISNEAKAAGVDLQLSGHTHAGQFFPWTLVVKKVHEFSSGLGRTGATWVYVNPGTGSWGPQVRLGTRTEITLLTLTKDS